MLSLDNSFQRVKFSSPSSGDKLLAIRLHATIKEIAEFSSPSSGDKLLAKMTKNIKIDFSKRSSRLLLAEISC